MPKVKIKRIPKKKTPKSQPPVVSATELDMDGLFEEILTTSPPEKKKGSSKSKLRKKSPEMDETKKDLIKRITKIYKDNEATVLIDLKDYSAGQLRAHFNQLQWGLSYLVRKGVVSDSPDQFPEDGFKCEAGTHKVWTNQFYCSMRMQYPELYPSCRNCSSIEPVKVT